MTSPRCPGWLAALSIFALSCLSVVSANSIINATRSSVVLTLPTGNIQIYPPLEPTVDVCPDAVWKSWKLHTAPPSYDPLHWTNEQWRDYIKEYPLRSAILSLIFLVIAIVAFVATAIWRCVQWCVSCVCCRRCRHACSVGTEDTAFLGDRKHTYLKMWIFLLLAGALSMIIWGMLGLNKDLLANFWRAVWDVLDYGNDVTNMLSSLEERMTVDLAANVSAAAAVIAAALDPKVLVFFAKAGFEFAPAGALTSSSLLASTTAMQAGLQDSVLPGLTALEEQLGATGSSRRRSRQLSDSSGDHLSGLLQGLSTGLPTVARAEDTRTGIRDNLRALSIALARAQAVTSRDSPEVGALNSALEATTLGNWEAALGNLTQALQVYDAARTGTALRSTADAAARVLSGAQALSPAAVDQLNSRMAELDELVQGPYDALQALRLRLVNINDVVLDTSNWTVVLANGTDVKLPTLLDLMEYCIGRVMVFLAPALSSGGRGLLGVPPLSQAVLNCSSSLNRVAGSLDQLASAASSGADTFGSGPDPAPALAQISSDQLSALAALAGPVSATASALSTYQADPSPTHLAQLRAAAANASAFVGQAVAAFEKPLVNGTALVSTAEAAQAGVESLVSTCDGLQDKLTAVRDTVDEISGQSLASWQEDLQELLKVLEQAPPYGEVQDQLLTPLDAAQGTITTVTSDIRTAVDQAGASIDEAATKVQDNILDPSITFVDNKQQVTQDLADITYPIWMSLWALCVLLVLVLALAVYLNWPAGIVTACITLLALVLVSQIVTSVLAFGMALLLDACNNAENVMMTEAVQYSADPLTGVVLSYYLYGTPDNTSMMLEAAFDLNVTDVRLKLQSVNETVRDNFDNAGSVIFRRLVTTLMRNVAGRAVDLIIIFQDILRMLEYQTVNALYVNTKRSICCDAGGFAYNQWCAMTAAAALIFGALISVSYLLARMDMLSERRRGCCSCCACAMYRPHNGYLADCDLAEDQFAKEARKQQELILQQQRLREQAQVQGPDGTGAAAGAIAGGPGGSEPGPGGWTSGGGTLHSGAVMPVNGAAAGAGRPDATPAVEATAAPLPPSQMVMSS